MRFSRKTACLLWLFSAVLTITCSATFHPGDRGAQIREIQQALVNDGISLGVDGDYGTSTTEAIRKFQAAHGLECDGILGAQTYAALMGRPMPENRSEYFVQKSGLPDAELMAAEREITAVQAALAGRGYDLSVDGIFGINTEQAVRDFQTKQGLDADGIVGNLTYTSLTGQTLQGGSLRRVGNTGNAGNKELFGRLMAVANSNLGVPYVFGGTTPAGFDCSGFTRYVYESVGIELPRMADEQFTVGSAVETANLQPGDLVFFSTYASGISHSGIYIGNGQFIHAGNNGVSMDNLFDEYWSPRYRGAKRIFC